MRTRSKVLPSTSVALGPLNWQVRNSSGVLTENAVNQAIGRTIITFEGSEVITDDPSPGRGVKSLSHRKEVTARYPSNASYYKSVSTGSTVARQGPGALWYEWNWGASSPVTLVFPSTHTHGNVLYTNSESQLIANAVHAFYATNETDNLLNIIEAPQLVQSLVSLKRTLTSPATVRALTDALWRLKNPKGLSNEIKNLIQNIKNTKSAKKRYAFKQELSFLKKALGKHGTNISGGFLAYQFGIAPLVSDMRKVHAALDSLKSRMKAASKSAGKLVSIHQYDSGTLEFRTTAGVSVGSAFVPASGYVKWHYAEQTNRRVCTVRGYRSQKYSSVALQQLDYYLGRFGATGPATLVKELIPFSFVLEWFVDLRNITDRLDNLLTGNSKRIIDVCMSEKSQYAIEGRLYNRSPTSYSEVLGLGSVLVSTNVSQYNRKPITAYNIVGSSGRFGKKQAALLGALLHQQVANLFR